MECIADTPQVRTGSGGAFFAFAQCGGAPCEGQKATFRDFYSRCASRSDVKVPVFSHLNRTMWVPTADRITSIPNWP
jgi:hypothetical protein